MALQVENPEGNQNSASTEKVTVSWKNVGGKKDYRKFTLFPLFLLQ